MAEQNKSRKILKIIVIVAVVALVIVGVVTLIGFVSLVSQPSTVVSTQQVVTTPVMMWHTAINLKDSGKFLNTPAFAMQGTEWRIVWSCALVDKSIGEGDFAGSIASIINNSGHNFAIGDSCTSGTTIPTYYYGEKPGQYYLRLGPTNATYSVKVEDYY